jgi:hypothetical protein
MMVKNCALYTDFKDLYNKTCPPVASMQATMETFEVEHYQMKAMIRKFDETLALKTNKTDFFDLRNKQE